MAMRCAALVMLVGCAGTQGLRDRHAGQLQLTFHNEVGSAICALHVFGEGETNQGPNWLKAGTEIPAGGSAVYWLPPATYQFRVSGCTYEKLQVTGYAPQVTMNTHGAVVLYREDDARSTEAATAIAHRQENTTRIPAKLTANKSPTPRPAPAAPPKP